MSFVLSSIRNEVAEIMSSYLFISICNCVGALCTVMFQLQVVCFSNSQVFHEKKETKINECILFKSASNLSIEIYQAFGIGSLMVLFLFLFSYFGEMVTTRSLAIADSAWNSLWYIYPVQYQKYLKLTIGYSHIEFHFSGMGLMYCTMASFSGVSHNHAYRRIFSELLFDNFSPFFQLVKTAVSFFMLFRNVA